jgi:hypothetical protein
MALAELLNGYVDRPELGAGLDRYVVPPGLADPAIAGALALAGQAASETAAAPAAG